MQNASCFLEGEKATWHAAGCSKLNDVRGQGGVIFFPARQSSLLAEHAVACGARSVPGRSICDEWEDQVGCWARDADADADADGRGLSWSHGVTACHSWAADDDLQPIEHSLIARTLQSTGVWLNGWWSFDAQSEFLICCWAVICGVCAVVCISLFSRNLQGKLDETRRVAKRGCRGLIAAAAHASPTWLRRWLVQVQLLRHNEDPKQAWMRRDWGLNELWMNARATRSGRFAIGPVFSVRGLNVLLVKRASNF
jgi:hypothetical protein